MTQARENKDVSRVLMELRPCMEGFAGIPQETRLLFSAFQGQEHLRVDGLINHGSRVTNRGLRSPSQFMGAKTHRKYNILSAFIVSQEAPLKFDFPSKLARALSPFKLAMKSRLGLRLPLDYFEAEGFPDFIWEMFFSKSLPRQDFQRVVSAGYRVLSAPWGVLNQLGMPNALGVQGTYPVIDTTGYDIFLSQTPCPVHVVGGTQMVVRYHDAIPIFLPHFIPDMKKHRSSHYYALRANAPSAIFACTTEAVRQDLLRIFPEVERRSVVIHDVVSHEYYPEVPKPGRVADILGSRLDETTHVGRAARHKLRNAPWPRIGKKIKEDAAPASDPRFLLMVSTIEPRKNHLRLVRAWERLRAAGDNDLKLVIVGTLGWGYEPIVNAFRPWQERAELFHLSRVPASDLRQLYATAECVVCPSVAEGFDLSGIEAMLCGGAVVASDIPVHREVLGTEMKYFDAYSVGGMADAIASFTGPSRVEQRRTAGDVASRYALQYSRDAITPRWLDFFDRVRAGDFAARR